VTTYHKSNIRFKFLDLENGVVHVSIVTNGLVFLKIFDFKFSPLEVLMCSFTTIKIHYLGNQSPNLIHFF